MEQMTKVKKTKLIKACTQIRHQIYSDRFIINILVTRYTEKKKTKERKGKPNIKTYIACCLCSVFLFLSCGFMLYRKHCKLNTQYTTHFNYCKSIKNCKLHYESSKN